MNLTNIEAVENMLGNLVVFTLSIVAYWCNRQNNHVTRTSVVPDHGIV